MLRGGGKGNGEGWMCFVAQGILNTAWVTSRLPPCKSSLARGAGGGGGGGGGKGLG